MCCSSRDKGENVVTQFRDWCWRGDTKPVSAPWQAAEMQRSCLVPPVSVRTPEHTLSTRCPSPSALSGSSASVLVAGCGPFCAPQACFEVFVPKRHVCVGFMPTRTRFNPHPLSSRRKWRDGAFLLVRSRTRVRLDWLGCCALSQSSSATSLDKPSMLELGEAFRFLDAVRDMKPLGIRASSGSNAIVVFCTLG